MSNNLIVRDQRFILTQVSEVTLLFPAQLVVETLLIERTQILSLPFYASSILGCVQVGGQVITLLSSAQLLGLKSNLIREVLTVVRLGETAKQFAGVGLLVDQMLGSQTGVQIPQSSSPERTRLFDLSLLGESIFKPQRWCLTDHDSP
jgi:chemotaxis signal transduction protein